MKKTTPSFRAISLVELQPTQSHGYVFAGRRTMNIPASVTDEELLQSGYLDRLAAVVLKKGWIFNLEK